MKYELDIHEVDYQEVICELWDGEDAVEIKLKYSDLDYIHEQVKDQERVFQNSQGEMDIESVTLGYFDFIDEIERYKETIIDYILEFKI